MKKFLAAVLMLTASLSYAWDQRTPAPVDACQQHSPYGWAQTARAATPI